MSISTDWLMVIITAIYVVATILICVYNAKSAKAAREQAKQMRIQFELTNRPKITVEIVYLRRLLWALRFTNHGATTAFNTRITLNQDFINGIPEEEFRSIVQTEVNKVRTIGVNQHYDIFFGGTRFRGENKIPVLKGRMSYSGSENALFIEDFEIELNDYAIFYSVNSYEEDIEKAIQKQTAEIQGVRCAIEKLTSTESCDRDETQNRNLSAEGAQGRESP